MTDIQEERGRVDTTAAVSRGVVRFWFERGYSPLLELTTASGRRIDVVALGPKGDILAVEIKSSLADYRADEKWYEYFEWCDKLYFAVAPGFPVEILPLEAGLIIADNYGGDMMRDTVLRPLSAARRKAIMLRFARIAAERLARANIPGS